MNEDKREKEVGINNREEKRFLFLPTDCKEYDAMLNIFHLYPLFFLPNSYRTFLYALIISIQKAGEALLSIIIY